MGLLLSLIVALAAGVPEAPPKLSVTEFRLRGPRGPADEYIEIRNDTHADHVVRARDGSAGYAVATADGVTHAIIPNGFRISANGHVLLACSAYSLPVRPDIRYETEIPDNTAFAVFASADSAHFDRAFRIDSVAPASESSALFRKSSYRDVPEIDADQVLIRDSADFRFLVADAPARGIVARLGAPYPSNSQSPISSSGSFSLTLLDPSRAAGAAPNTEFDRRPQTNADRGVVTFRRRIRNNSPHPITTLHLRVSDIPTYPGTPDFRLLDSTTVKTLGNVAYGGGFDAHAVVTGVSDAVPLEPEQFVTIELRFGVMREGPMLWRIAFESLPAGVPGPPFKSPASRTRVDSLDTASIIWQNSRASAASLWLLNGGSVRGFELPAPRSDWFMEGSGDFAGACERDLFWRNRATGENMITLLRDGRVTATRMLPPMSVEWSVAGVGDFQADGRADILWRSVTGANRLWFIDAERNPHPAEIEFADPRWMIAAVGDFQGDGNADIFWRNPETGDNSVWLMSGANVVKTFPFPAVPPQWIVAGCGDFQEDGRDDIVWRNPASGDNSIWFMNGSTFVSAALPSFGGREWTVAAIGDFQHDGTPDLFWRNNESGENLIWLMSGPHVYPIETPAVAPAWRIMPRSSLDVAERAKDLDRLGGKSQRGLSDPR